MKTIKAVLVVATIATLSGCAVVPVGPGYYAPAPVYYGPSLGIGVYGGLHGGGRGGWR